MVPKAMLSYPQARRGQEVEDHFGTSVADPYRWLEDPESEETKAFVAAENEVSEKYLNTPIRDQILKALTKFQDYPKFGTPFKEGDFWYSWRNAGLQNQSILHRHTDKKGESSEVFLDPNSWTEDGTASVGSFKFTADGSLMAYARGDKGSDWRTIYIVDVATGKTLEDRLHHAKFTSLQWVGNKYLFYNRYDVPEGADANGLENTQNEFQKLYCHEVGTPQTQDVLVLEFPTEPTWMAHATVTDDEKFVVASISRSCEPTNKLWIAALPAAGAPISAFKELQWVKVADDFEAGFEYVANDEGVFLFTTNRDAPKNKIVKVDIAKPVEVVD
ncbi:uncharacterized protein EMH_0030780 [Eimeria mitis]|uniref:Peptidase S9A N-terminal domain-containing protein n=1 Tax=Eimeria mitis TaxID=44415 RepID=U6JPB6_9EIME|nr:uncharacterized protein EMH_0030780 [Eimeria mitis]CDJ27325.1 hypothetical protein EMH_0030780 [Eimeria mitis]